MNLSFSTDEERKIIFFKIIIITANKSRKEQVWLGKKEDQLGTMQVAEAWLYRPMSHALVRICPGKWVTQSSLKF